MQFEQGEVQLSQVGIVRALFRKVLGPHVTQVKVKLLYPKPVWQLVHFVVLSMQFLQGAVQGAHTGGVDVWFRKYPGGQLSQVLLEATNP